MYGCNGTSLSACECIQVFILGRSRLWGAQEGLASFPCLSLVAVVSRRGFKKNNKF